jgi:hypothetical protein
VQGEDVMAASIAALRTFRTAIETAYGPAADRQAEMVVGEAGSLADIVAFARG